MAVKKEARSEKRWLAFIEVRVSHEKRGTKWKRGGWHS
jgi:hypothetical protein